MSAIFTKLKDFVGIHEDDYYDREELLTEEDDRSDRPQPEENLETARSERRNRRRSNRESINPAGAETIMNRTTKSNVVGMPGITSTTSEVVIIEPHSFEEMPQVIQTLRERRSVVLNLNSMEAEEAQRAVDFVAGGTYALDGHQERIGESIFLFAPSCVKVSTFSGLVREVTAPPEQIPQAPVAARHGWAPEATRIAQ
ncbi:MAG: cell division protein SepF [Prochloraceae cyanobacterium]